MPARQGQSAASAGLASRLADWVRCSANISHQRPHLLKGHELFGDPNPRYFHKSTAVQIRGVLQHKWEKHCDTNGRCTANRDEGLGQSFHFLLVQRKRSTAGNVHRRQSGSVLQHLLREQWGLGLPKYDENGGQTHKASSTQAGLQMQKSPISMQKYDETGEMPKGQMVPI